MTAASLDADYALGFVDGLARRPMLDVPVAEGHYTAADIVEVYELGRRVGRAEQGIDGEVVDLVTRIAARLRGESAPACSPRGRHLRLVEP